MKKQISATIYTLALIALAFIIDACNSNDAKEIPQYTIEEKIMIDGLDTMRLPLVFSADKVFAETINKLLPINRKNLGMEIPAYYLEGYEVKCDTLGILSIVYKIGQKNCEKNCGFEAFANIDLNNRKNISLRNINDEIWSWFQSYYEFNKLPQSIYSRDLSNSEMDQNEKLVVNLRNTMKSQKSPPLFYIKKEGLVVFLNNDMFWPSAWRSMEPDNEYFLNFKDINAMLGRGLVDLQSFLYVIDHYKDAKLPQAAEADTAITETKEDNQDVASQPEKSETRIDGDLSSYLTETTFSINGNGVVTFRANTLGSNKGEITIRGGDADLLGRYVLSGSTLMISNLSAVNGYFDASNNNGSSGMFRIESDGTITGTLRAKSGQRSITFYPK